MHLCCQVKGSVDGAVQTVVTGTVDVLTEELLPAITEPVRSIADTLTDGLDALVQAVVQPAANVMLALVPEAMRDDVPADVRDRLVGTMEGLLARHLTDAMKQQIDRAGDFLVETTSTGIRSATDKILSANLVERVSAVTGQAADFLETGITNTLGNIWEPLLDLFRNLAATMNNKTSGVLQDKVWALAGAMCCGVVQCARVKYGVVRCAPVCSTAWDSAVQYGVVWYNTVCTINPSTPGGGGVEPPKLGGRGKGSIVRTINQ